MFYMLMKYRISLVLLRPQGKKEELYNSNLSGGANIREKYINSFRYKRIPCRHERHILRQDCFDYLSFSWENYLSWKGSTLPQWKVNLSIVNQYLIFYFTYFNMLSDFIWRIFQARIEKKEYKSSYFLYLITVSNKSLKQFNGNLFCSIFVSYEGYF